MKWQEEPDLDTSCWEDLKSLEADLNPLFKAMAIIHRNADETQQNGLRSHSQAREGREEGERGLGSMNGFFFFFFVRKGEHTRTTLGYPVNFVSYFSNVRLSGQTNLFHS